MGFIKKGFKFTLGGLTGAAVGATAALLFAPDSGNGLQQKIRDRIRDAKYDGAQAKEAKENELIQKYRLEVNDTAALKAAEASARAERDEAVAALNLNAKPTV